jgi:SAM-dependent methyltransferase
MFVYGLTILLAAFLLFQVQPLIAKMILPWFGGASSVWSACMLFFQAVLLGGYLYAHWLHEKLAPRRQAVLHTALIAASLLLLPPVPDASWKGAGLTNPEWRILGLLAVTIGLPYFLLSTTSPLVQTWYARTHGAVPYRLYALSNAGSMLGLVTYPVVIEPRLAVGTQATVWSAAYALFALLCAVAAWRAARTRVEGPAMMEDPAMDNAPSRGLQALWAALAACASTLLLAITAFLTQDVAAVPFLWVAPLSVYLLSFILCFQTPRVYDRRLWLPLLGAALGWMGYLTWPESPDVKVPTMVLAAVSALFICAMVCHGEIVRSRPHPRYLTGFYLMIALGGVLGGVFVSIVAPKVFRGFHELPIGLAACGFLALAAVSREKRAWESRGAAWAASLVVMAALGGYSAWLAATSLNALADSKLVVRNFYGQLRIKEVDEGDGLGPRRKLVHGVINHGEQILREDFRRRPVTYYCAQSGVARVLNATSDGPPRRIGVLGLGCGTLAAFGRKGDVIRFYEINPLVPQLARTQFTYLSDSPARTEIVLGDGRLMLEREPDQNFDLLAMDAFSGDSVPVHLITREAFRTYLRHLKPDGVLAVNISNKYLDLAPVVERGAAAFGKVAVLVDYEAEQDDPECFSSSWALVMDKGTWERLRPKLAEDARLIEPRPQFRPWTDDYSSLFAVLK